MTRWELQRARDDARAELRALLDARPVAARQQAEQIARWQAEARDAARKARAIAGLHRSERDNPHVQRLDRIESDLAAGRRKFDELGGRSADESRLRARIAELSRQLAEHEPAKSRPTEWLERLREEESRRASEAIERDEAENGPRKTMPSISGPLRQPLGVRLGLRTPWGSQAPEATPRNRTPRDGAPTAIPEQLKTLSFQDLEQPE